MSKTSCRLMLECKEFVSSIIIELVNLWPTIQIINGRSRHPASQSLVEQANRILETKLGKWMEDNNFCRAHNKKPYELVFGGTPHRYSAMLDQLFQNNIFSEDEIPNEFEGKLNLDEDAHSLQLLTNQLTVGHQVLQNFAYQNLKTYIIKKISTMIVKSKHKLKYEIGKYVKILISKIDRFGTDQPVLPCKVIEKLNYNDIFKYYLECISEILNNLYYADELNSFKVKEYPELDHIPTDNISVKEAA
ncbi:hypothetical protein RhiirB3_453159 [Rhizophagus irregularis]|nr:hypothetical protein RhiirB3_453159 [Rhizophagus irregularis]